MSIVVKGNESLLFIKIPKYSLPGAGDLYGSTTLILPLDFTLLKW